MQRITNNVAHVPVTQLPNIEKRFGVIDIGSNSVRLVVFEGLVRAPLPIYNEKVLAGLGRSLASTGRLDAEGGTRALNAVSRYSALCRSLGAGAPEIVATAAVREAEDGSEFVAAVEERAGTKVRVLRGREEARLSALGVGAAIPEATGLMGDLGGGSLELTILKNGIPGEGITLPLGPLRLMGLTRDQAEAVVDDELSDLEWLWAQSAGADFYAVGGAWRSFVRVDMARNKGMLPMIHHYSMERDRVLTMAKVMAGLSEQSMRGVAGISRRRQEGLPLAALVLGRVLEAADARKVIFSANGLREGIVHDRLSSDEAALDPLLEAARRMAKRAGCSGSIGAELQAWLGPMMAPQSNPRLVNAACLLSDVSWSVHSDFRAEQAMVRILHAPFVGIDHPGRAFVALAVAVRYGAGHDLLHVAQVKGLLDADGQSLARSLGLALRLGHTLSGGSVGVLPKTRLSSSETTVTLALTTAAAPFSGEKVKRRLTHLASALGRNSELVLEV